jgi:hypothetical protein
MQGYWWELFKRWAKSFTDFVKFWWFWCINIGAAVVVALPAETKQALYLDRLPWWLLVAAIGASAAITFLQTTRAHYKELFDEHMKCEDWKVEHEAARKKLEHEVSRLNGELTSADERRREHVAKVFQELITLQEQGLDLKLALPRSWNEQYTDRISNWAQRTGLHLKTNYPTFYNQFFLPPSATVMAGPPKRAKDANALNGFLKNLQDIITEIRRATT